MPQYTITLSDAQDKALRHVALDPQDWIENATFNRCRIAIEVIVDAEIKRLRAAGQSVSGTDDEIVMGAPIKSIAEMDAERKAEEAARQAMALAAQAEAPAADTQQA